MQHACDRRRHSLPVPLMSTRSRSAVALFMLSVGLVGCAGESSQSADRRAPVGIEECVERNDWLPARCERAVDLDMLCDDGRPTCGSDKERALERCQVLLEESAEFKQGKVMVCAEQIGAYGLCPNGLTGGRSTKCPTTELGSLTSSRTPPRSSPVRSS